jgi:hypothetical protein
MQFLDTMEPSSLWNPATTRHEALLGRKGIHGGENAFCSGQVTTHSGEVLIFGGHDDDDPTEMRWFRRYNHASRSLDMSRMSSPRWYPSPTTLPDGRIIVVGGVPDPGDAGYDGITRHPWSNPALDNPTYEVYDPWSSKFSGDKWDMSAQLGAAHPINTYPFVVVTPDGNLAVSAGRLLWKYNWVDTNQWIKAFEFQPRPGAPWSYPQTGERAAGLAAAHAGPSPSPQHQQQLLPGCPLAAPAAAALHSKPRAGSGATAPFFSRGAPCMLAARRLRPALSLILQLSTRQARAPPCPCSRPGPSWSSWRQAAPARTGPARTPPPPTRPRSWT